MRRGGWRRDGGGRFREVVLELGLFFRFAFVSWVSTLFPPIWFIEGSFVCVRVWEEEGFG